MSELAIKLINEAYEKKSTFLDLGNCGLTAIPKEIVKLRDCLEHLNLGPWYQKNGIYLAAQNSTKGNSFFGEPASFGILEQLKNFINLGLYNTGVNYIGLDYISKLVSLNSLDLGANNITAKDIYKIIRLSSLVSLNLDHNQIGEEGAEYISSLSSLSSLSLSHNEIGEKGVEYISSLFSLSSLNLALNRIEARGAEYISNLSALHYLNLDWNSIREKGAEYISRLSSLTSLHLAENKIGEKGAACISKLSSLTTLNLDGNEIGDKGAAEISKLSSLIALNLQNNSIGNDGAAHISKLLALDFLNLGNNNVTMFVPAASNTIKTISLEHNGIENLTLNLLRQIPLEIDLEENLSFELSRLFLYGNPIKNIPPEVLKKGRAAILEYLEGNLRPLNECKLIFVGDGEVGKTSLMKRLVTGAFAQGEGTTHGINKIAWQGFENAKGEPIKVNLWDFGGQHIQHSLHQFFFTQRAVYVLVLNPRNDEKAAYWLDQVDKLGYGSQLIIVYNWKEERDIQADWSKNFKELRKAYKYLPDPIVLNCKTGAGMEVFEERVRAAVLSNEGLTTQYPETWFNIKQKLETGIPIEKHYIEYEQYEQWCSEEEYNEPERQRTLLNILDSIGTIVFFDRPGLRNLQVLNPEWISTGAYAIITSRITREKKEHLAWADLQEIFCTPKEIFADKNISITYTENQFKFILELMLEYRLCQKNPFKEHEYLIPSAFGEQPKEYDTTNSRHYRLKFGSAFEMLVIHRFIAKNIVHIQGVDYWHSGIYFKHASSNTWALVETNLYSQEINCWIKGDNIRGLWEVIRNDFREIFSMYHNLPVEEEVEYTSGGRTVFLKYNQMLAALKRGVRIIQYDPATELENIDVNAVLELFEPVKENIRNMGNEQHRPEINPHVTVNIHNNNSPNQQVVNNPTITASPTITVSPEVTVSPTITASPSITNNPINTVTVTEPAPPKEAPKPSTHDTAAEDKAVRKWKNRALIRAIVSAVVTTVLVLALVNHWWFSESRWKWLEDNQIIKWIGILLSAGLNSFILKALYDRFLDPSKAKAYRETLRK